MLGMINLGGCLYELGFVRSTSYSYLFHLSLLYMNDVNVTGADHSDVMEIMDLLKQQFALEALGEVHYFLGIEVTNTGHKFDLCQTKYLHELLQKTNMPKGKQA